jgi:hypothetical protein
MLFNKRDIQKLQLRLLRHIDIYKHLEIEGQREG